MSEGKTPKVLTVECSPESYGEKGTLADFEYPCLHPIVECSSILPLHHQTAVNSKAVKRISENIACWPAVTCDSIRCWSNPARSYVDTNGTWFKTASGCLNFWVFFLVNRQWVRMMISHQNYKNYDKIMKTTITTSRYDRNTLLKMLKLRIYFI